MLGRRAFLGGVLGLAGTVTVSGRSAAGPVTTDQIGDRVQTVPRGQLPVFAREPDLAVLYRFAVERGDELRYMPCFCGCGRFGHSSNRECYLKARHADGSITFTSHAAT